MREITNPITRLDYPDPDVIRVEDTYYMVSTTMHFMPGCEILRSYDLVNWEHASYVYETLDSTPAQRLEQDSNIYGKGMWAASLRYHKGTFYICFVANDTHRTYLYTSESVTGPWRKQYIEGFYHDCSLLFDDDDRVYIIYGNNRIHLTELKPDLSGPREGGLDRIIVSDEGHPGLGYEGSHFYKINGKYYAFFIHSARDEWKRIEACFVADSPDGEFRGGDVLNDDMGYFNSGVAQGGIVDTPDGKWYAVLFQDRTAVGRIPVLVPVTWKGNADGNAFPVFGIDGKVPCQVETVSTRPDYHYEPLTGSDDFKGPLKTFWQWNHEPDHTLCCLDQESGCYRIVTGKICSQVTQAVNTLTQRMRYPACAAYVTVDGSKLKEGDYAGICALLGCYGWAGITREGNSWFVSMQAKEPKDMTFVGTDTEEMGTEYAKLPVAGPKVRLKLAVDFTEQKDTAQFYCLIGEEWVKLGIEHKLVFKLDHFVGCRFGLFCYATKETGGAAEFSDFVYEEIE